MDSFVLYKKMEEFGYNCSILTEENEILFSAKDIGKIFNIKNIRNSIINFNEDDKKIRKVSTNGGPQNKLFLTFNGLKKFLCRTRSDKIIKFASEMNLDLNDMLVITYETRTIDSIKTVFKNEKMINQHFIDKYKVDLYFPDYKLAIECDEKYHNNVCQKNKDNIREQYIKENLFCKFIRFNPNDKNFNIFEVINLIYEHIKNYNV
jgi:very-short-patch-repair endonuclease